MMEGTPYLGNESPRKIEEKALEFPSPSLNWTLPFNGVLERIYLRGKGLI